MIHLSHSWFTCLLHKSKLSSYKIINLYNLEFLLCQFSHGLGLVLWHFLWNSDFSQNNFLTYSPQDILDWKYICLYRGKLQNFYFLLFIWNTFWNLIFRLMIFLDILKTMAKLMKCCSKCHIYYIPYNLSCQYNLLMINFWYSCFICLIHKSKSRS